ncbi:hypothetical protein ATANTOWER_001139 [Ataeniobius toweri]|uniref:Uncharacterized protein n=1 Tax=Ataeniobius toweri TaxID=208326 RepID=A0ABU7AN87_9TELE|nr:hypothetical protein [Ataeniobius toweri]
METGNHRDRNKIICGSWCEDTQGKGRQLHTVEWHYPQQPPPLHLLPYGDLEETSSVVVMLRNDAGTLSTTLPYPTRPCYCNITPVVSYGRCSTPCLHHFQHEV